MQKLSLVVLIVFCTLLIKAQENPHGDELKFDCLDCHTTKGWTFSASTATFNHDKTTFKLEGQHVVTECKACHVITSYSIHYTKLYDTSHELAS